LHPSSYNQDYLVAEEEYPEPRWLTGSFQLSSRNEMIIRVRVDVVRGNLGSQLCGVTVGDPATLTLPSDTAGWKEAVTIGFDFVQSYGVEVRVDVVKGVSGVLYCGVTVGDPATLTLPSVNAGWEEAVTIGWCFIQSYDLHPSSYNQDYLMAKEEHPEPRWFSGSFQLSTHNEMIVQVTGRQLVRTWKPAYLHPSSYNHDYLMAEEKHPEPRWLRWSFQVRLEAVVGHRSFLFCGVTDGDPATLTLPSDTVGWEKAVTIGSDLHPSSYNHDYLMAEEEHSEPRWLSGSFQLSTRNEILSK
ncbi:hypothetical protein BaRGS_00020534, partial [Batillaria attramentaria]